MTYAVAAVALTRSNISVAGPASAVFDGYRVPSGGAADLRRVLLTAQTTASENGVWIFAGAGNPMSRPSAAGDPGGYPGNQAGARR